MNLSSVTIAVLGSAGYGALCAAATGSVAQKTECDRPVYLWEPADTGETTHQLPVTHTTDIYEALESADIVVVPWEPAERADSYPEEMTGFMAFRRWAYLLPQTAIVLAAAGSTEDTTNVSEHLRRILHAEFPTRRERVAVLTIAAHHLADTDAMELFKTHPKYPSAAALTTDDEYTHQLITALFDGPVLRIHRAP